MRISRNVCEAPRKECAMLLSQKVDDINMASWTIVSGGVADTLHLWCNVRVRWPYICSHGLKVA